MGHSRPKVLLGYAGVASSSTGTSNPVLVGDCRLLSLSIQSGSNASASRYTVSLSNNDGLQSATLHWSVVTTILGQGVYTIDPAGRWLQVERPDFAISGSSNCTVILNRYYE